MVDGFVLRRNQDLVADLQIAPGKLLRPTILLLSAQLCYGAQYGKELDAETRQMALKAAVAVEAIHTASLWHDDVLDCSPLRRGQQSVPELLGNRQAVLYGDMLMTQALNLIACLGNLSLLTDLTQVIMAMSQAQIKEQDQRGDTQTSLESYLEIIGGKTASLLAYCCLLGAVIGQGSQEEVSQLRRYGHNLGLAFQVGDDILDIWGDPQQTGKIALGDLEENNLTLPILLARDSATPEQRDRLLALLGLPASEVAQQLPRLLTETEALPQALGYAHRFSLKAESELANWPDSQELQLLLELARWSGRLEQLSSSN